MPDLITLRNPRPDELREFWRPLADAFAEPLNDDEIERERPLLDLSRFIGAFDGQTQVGTAGAYTQRLTIPGGEVGASAITGVGVRPDYRRQGILRQMMDWLLGDARTRGEPVAVLLASEAAIYQRFGFGQGTTASSFSVDTASVAFREPVDLGSGLRIRMVDTDEATDVFARIYDRVHPGIPGSLDRSEPRWKLWLVGDAEWMQRGQGIKYRAVLEVDGEPRGFAIYRIEHGWGTSGPASTMNVQEVLGVDAAAEQALWEWLFSMDLVRTVAARRGPVPHPLQHMLIEPRRLGLVVNDGMWLRLIDVAEALGARSYVGSGSLVLDVTDDMFESNAGRWEIRVADGRGVVSRAASAAPDLELDVAALASSYLGAYRFGDLAVAGRVRGCQPGALERADALFTPPRAPWNSTPF